jgi:ribonuclease HI
MTYDTAEQILIYTDGSCAGNPGAGGYAALIVTNGVEQVVTGQNPATTNNRMEMTAAIKALEALAVNAQATLHSDSEVVIKGMNEWLPKWKVKGWRGATRKPVSNRDLWEQLDKLNSERLITWTWVRGHNGHAENERVDALANAEAASAANKKGWSNEAVAAKFATYAKG